MILFAKQKWRQRHKGQDGYQGRRGEQDELGDWDRHINTIDTRYKVDN